MSIFVSAGVCCYTSGSLISDLIVHGDAGDRLSQINGNIDEEGEDEYPYNGPDGMSRNLISKREARLMRERSMTLPTPAKAEGQRLRHMGGFRVRKIKTCCNEISVYG